MKIVEVFDPAMCCSTGVCGVEVTSVLAQFAADLQWVEAQGVVARHNLGQEPQAFAASPAVFGEMEAGMDRLPILAVGGRIVSTGIYPSRAQLALRGACEIPIIRRVADELAPRCALVPWLAATPVGREGLMRLVGG